MPDPKNISLFTSPVSAGFPSPADDFLENDLNLNNYLINHPSATFFVRVKGDSMINCGINNGDMLIVDRSLEGTNNRIVVAMINGEFTVKMIRQTGTRTWLMPANQRYKPIEITDAMEFEIWGVVTYVIHSTLHDST